MLVIAFPKEPLIGVGDQFQPWKACGHAHEADFLVRIVVMHSCSLRKTPLPEQHCIEIRLELEIS